MGLADLPPEWQYYIYREIEKEHRRSKRRGKKRRKLKIRDNRHAV